MTYERFEELWKQYIPIPGSYTIDPKMPVDGCSKHTIDALVAACHGDFSHFDRIDEILAKHDEHVTAKMQHL